MTSLWQQLANLGDGYLVAAIFGVMCVMLWRRTVKLADKFQQLGMASIRADVEHTKTLEEIRACLNNIEKQITDIDKSTTEIKATSGRAKRT